MKKLIRGILDFRKNLLPDRRETFARLAAGQAPDVLFITCSDSRVAPNWFASTDPGDLFVIRNVGNMVPACDRRGDIPSERSVAAAIDFSLFSLNVSHIVVCGHSGCGAIHAMAQGIEKLESPHLKAWLSAAQQAWTGPAQTLDPDPRLSAENKLSQKSVLQQIENLKTYPKVRERLADDKLKLHAWWFDIAQGGVFAFNEKSHRFALIDDEMGQELLSDG